MKIILAMLLFACLNAIAQASFQAGQQWQVSEGENIWVVAIEKDFGEGFFSAYLVSGEIPANHDLFVSAEVSGETLALEFILNPNFVTDSSFGFSCAFTPTTDESINGELRRFRGSVAGPQWLEETEKCEVKLVSP
jgi:hypothetical protein